MKRYLIYLAIISLGTIAFSNPPLAQRAYASDSKAPAKAQTAAPKSVTTPKTATVATQPEIKPTIAPTQPTPPAFDANNPATWPSCPATQIVWAQDGQCHDKLATPVYVAPTQTQVAYTAPAPASSGNTGQCGDNEYAHYIYMHESGCDTDRYNSIGCYGIGQSCPKSKIAQCGADYACQNAWFSNYAEQRYGGWAGAYQFWINNHYW